MENGNVIDVRPEADINEEKPACSNKEREDCIPIGAKTHGCDPRWNFNLRMLGESILALDAEKRSGQVASYPMSCKANAAKAAGELFFQYYRKPAAAMTAKPIKDLKEIESKWASEKQAFKSQINWLRDLSKRQSQWDIEQMDVVQRQNDQDWEEHMQKTHNLVRHNVINEVNDARYEQSVNAMTELMMAEKMAEQDPDFSLPPERKAELEEQMVLKYVNPDDRVTSIEDIVKSDYALRKSNERNQDAKKVSKNAHNKINVRHLQAKRDKARYEFLHEKQWMDLDIPLCQPDGAVKKDQQWGLIDTTLGRSDFQPRCACTADDIEICLLAHIPYDYLLSGKHEETGFAFQINPFPSHLDPAGYADKTKSGAKLQVHGQGCWKKPWRTTGTSTGRHGFIKYYLDGTLPYYRLEHKDGKEYYVCEVPGSRSYPRIGLGDDVNEARMRKDVDMWPYLYSEAHLDRLVPYSEHKPYPPSFAGDANMGESFGEMNLIMADFFGDREKNTLDWQNLMEAGAKDAPENWNELPSGGAKCRAGETTLKHPDGKPLTCGVFLKYPSDETKKRNDRIIKNIQYQKQDRAMKQSVKGDRK